MVWDRLAVPVPCRVFGVVSCSSSCDCIQLSSPAVSVLLSRLFLWERRDRKRGIALVLVNDVVKLVRLPIRLGSRRLFIKGGETGQVDRVCMHVCVKAEVVRRVK